MSTRVVSFRMTENQYDKMMAECHQMGISSAEWTMQKIAFAKSVESKNQEILNQLRYVRRKLKYTEDKKSGLEILDELINSLD